MRKYLFIIYVSVAWASDLRAAIINGTITMPTQRSGYMIASDTLLILTSSQLAPVDVLIQNIGCTLSCPGTCIYRITGCNGIFEFKIPIDSVDFRSPIDTLDDSVIERRAQGIVFSAESLYEKEPNPGISFIVKDCTGKFALFRIVSFVRKAGGPAYPGDCYGYEVSSVAANWSYQTDGSLKFSSPLFTNRNGKDQIQFCPQPFLLPILLIENAITRGRLYCLDGRAVHSTRLSAPRIVIQPRPDN